MEAFVQDTACALRAPRKSPALTCIAVLSLALGISANKVVFGVRRSRFGGNPQIAGTDIRINGHPYTVLGVAPRAFHGTEIFYWSEIPPSPNRPIRIIP